jgi:hypothetical protein
MEAEAEVARLREERNLDARERAHDAAEIARLRNERRGLWRFVKPVEGAPVVYVGVHAVRWYEAAGEYEPTAGFVQADLEVTP